MCGLVGLFLPDGASPATPDLGAMMTAISHRGPDGEGRFVSNDRRTCLGFVRLAIIDLDTGNQPLQHEDSGTVMVGNGEIYNYRELRADPRLRDFPFRTKGDMEAAFASALHLGPDFVGELRGMFALALVEQRPRRLTLVRDRLGIKPLYWTTLANGGVLFASEIKALLASGLISAEADERAVSDYLSHGWVPAPRTLYKNIHTLPAAHVMTVDSAGNINTRRYWTPAPSPDMPTAASDIEAYLVERMRESVRIHMRSDVPVGALLSGGLDSGLLVALAAEQTDKVLKTFTVRFAGASYDETPLAASVAELYETDHRVINVGSEDVDDLLPRMAWHLDQPLFDAAVVPSFLIQQELGKSVKVALNGSGGDELFAGYGRYFPLNVERDFLRLPRSMRRSLAWMADQISPMTAFRLRRAEKFTACPGDYLHDHTGHFPDPMRQRIGNTLPIGPSAQQAAFDQAHGPHQSRMLAADLQTYLIDNLMLLLDRTSMAVGVEGRVPLLDHPLVEVALAVPPELRTDKGMQKALERRIAGRFLPERIVAAPKQGFTSPVPGWWRNGLAPAVEALLTRPKTLERGWWTGNGIQALLSDLDRYGYQIYTLVMLELCIRLFVENQPLASLSEMARAR